MIEITDEHKERMASFWYNMVSKQNQEFVVKEKYDELKQEIERLTTELDKTRLSELDKEYRINKAIEQLEELKNLYDDNYTISDKASDVIEILKGE